MPTQKVTKLTVDAATPSSTAYFLWDSELRGFGVRITPSGRKSYVCQYRTSGGRSGNSRRLTLGVHGSPWTPETARREAKKILGRAANGADPAQEKRDARRRMTVAELCDQYLAEGCATKKPSTLTTDKSRIERHIKPLLGTKRVQEVTKADVKRFLQDVANGKTKTDIKTRARGRAIVRGGRGAASRTVGLLGGIFSFAVDSGIIRESPTKGVKRFPDRKGQRYLSPSELTRLGEALRQAASAGENPRALAMIELLVLTGARKGEIQGLTWRQINLASARLELADSKTGQKAIPLNTSALRVLQEQPRMEGSDFVFPSSRGDGPFQGLPKVWERVRATAELTDVRIHDLRHSFASVAVSSGASLPIIGALLGHSCSSTTQRYAHLSDDPLRCVSQDVAGFIEAALEHAECRRSQATLPSFHDGASSLTEVR